MKQLLEIQDILIDARDFANAASMAAAGHSEVPSLPIIACAELAVEKIIKASDLLQQVNDIMMGICCND